MDNAMFMNFLVDLEIILRKSNTCIANLSDEDFTAHMNAIFHKMELLGGMMPSGGGPGPGSSVVGTIQHVVPTEGGPAVRALVLGNPTGDPYTLPNGTGTGQNYQGGVILTNGANATEPFVVPVSNMIGHSNPGEVALLVGEGDSLALSPIMSDLSIAPAQTVVLVPIS
jgi:hypothetical protein